MQSNNMDSESTVQRNMPAMPGLALSLNALLEQMNNVPGKSADLDQLVELISTATTDELNSAERALKLFKIKDLKAETVISFVTALPDDFQFRKSATTVVDKSSVLDSLSMLTAYSKVDYRNIVGGSFEEKVKGVKNTIALSSSLSVPTQFGIADWMAEYLVNGKNLNAN